MTSQEPELPFVSLDYGEFRAICPGPRLASVNSNPKSYYGPITIRNYIAGWTKQKLRTQKTWVRPPETPTVFLLLPIEMKLVVLEHLHPIDLYHFSLTSRNFRSIVMDPKAKGVWEIVFQKHPELPSCPRGVLQSHWAFLLYGPGICTICDRYGALTDFAFRKQYCELCMRDNYAYANMLRDTHDNSIPPDHLILSLIPRTYRYHGLRYTTSYDNSANARYLRDDFQVMLKKVTLIQLLIQYDDVSLTPLAELFEEYKTTRTFHLGQIHQSAKKTNAWATEIFRSFSFQYDIMLKDAVSKCTKRLLNVGHERQDLDHVQFSLAHTLRVAGIYRLTSKAYRFIRHKLEAVVIIRKVERLKMERNILIKRIYRDYKKLRAPNTWEYLPPTRLVTKVGGFAAFLNAEFTRRGDIPMEYAISLFPDFITEWTREQNVKIFRLLSSEPEVDVGDLTRKFELATCVVTCGDCRFKRTDGIALFGWDEIFLHMRKIVPGHRKPCNKYMIMEVAKIAASSLVSCAGLDPTITTSQEMHNRNDRFVCGTCMEFASQGVYDTKAYTWTECVVHTIEVHPDIESPIWHLLTPEVKRFVQEHESLHPRPISRIWRCNKCATHYASSVRQKEAIEHVQKKHLIANPVIGTDIVYDKRRTIKRRKPFRLGINPGYTYQCKRCHDLPILKLWQMQPLLYHLRLKHHIPEPLEGEDWVKVSIMASEI